MVTGESRLSAFVDSDLFILTSYSENFGIAPAEALAMGLPVLLSDQVGIARQVAQVRAGAVVQLDVSHIAWTWSALLDNPTELKAMGMRGRKLVQEEYDADVVVHKMLDVYHQVIQDWQVAQCRKR
jgi:glycosyltransferase involved in cell wall biosynthesis